MLVISRKVNETFIINDNITVQILEINGDKIKIGIEAPKDIRIMRSEILETEKLNIEAQNNSIIIDQEKINTLNKKIIKKKP
ncbi:MAG: carbon storage regulator CsrA [Clostridia bacterium]|nr:carbon storage regulator CsrA [Clostridia bacterium]